LIGRATGERAIPGGFSEEDIGVDGDGPTGVKGTGSVVGVLGNSTDGIGVRGASDQFIGVEGLGWTGVEGNGSHTGVRGLSPGPNAAVLAESRPPKGNLDNGLALQVLGQATFSNSGVGVIPSGQSESGPIAPPNGLDFGAAHVLVTLTGDPGGRAVEWVEVNPTEFVVHLTSGPSSPEVPFTYLVLQVPTLPA